MYASKHSRTGLEDDILEKMRIAQEQDPDNLYLAAHYLDQRAQRGERIEDEARELATKVLRSPVSSYSGLKPLLWVYSRYISDDEAIDLAEEALKNHPDERYLKRCVTLCYKWKIISPKQSRPEKSMIDRAILLLEEVIALYPDSSLMKKIEIADVYALSHDGQAKADQKYQELLDSDLELKEIHLETLAGKTYTLMMFNGDIKLVADYFQRAIEMQPDMVEWNSWPVLALVYASKHSRTGLEDDILEKMRIAQEQDPENLYLAAHYLDQRAQRGERIEDEARDVLSSIPSFHSPFLYISLTVGMCCKFQRHFVLNYSGCFKIFLTLLFSISAAQTLVSRLKALQCHFTWDLGLSRSLLLRCRDNLLDIGTENGNPWLGHIYNLRGFIQYRLGFSEDAQSFFNKAKQAFCKIRSADEGPWLVVNYGNLAWLHHSLGNQAESEDYLYKIDALNKNTHLHPRRSSTLRSTLKKPIR
ncbi:hypothetical protein F7725_028123 [Dissostichus mawsoni]|uniref:Uncharacterized protein n=1 Tax=Dissostichus mawsoni TaxID=36200 RepID=A0A7J5XET0_DISMA|nr:hypothetical protein F7725_028123 [Dissostichus mawsoni]